MSASTNFKITTTTEYDRPLRELEYFLFSYWDVWSTELIQSEDIDFIDDEGDDDIKTKNIFEVVIFELDHNESKNIIEKIKEKAKVNGCEIEIVVFFGYLSHDEILKL